MKRETVADLKRQIEILAPYQEAYFCFSHGETPIVVTSGERSVKVLGLARSCGGVVVEIDDETCMVHYVSRLMAEWSQGHDPYLRDIVSKVTRLQREAIEARYKKAE